MTNIEPTLIGSQEMATRIRVAKPLLLSWVKEGCPAVLAGNRFLFDERDVLDWIKQNKIVGGKP
jgi:hypothetical protein